AVRTPVGRKGGVLAHLHASELLARSLTAIVQRNRLAPEAVDDVIAGCAAQVGEQAGNVARTGLLMARFPVTVPGTTVNRACGSSQQAAHFADNMIRAGVCDVVIACGVESMSHTGGGNDDTKYGRRHPPELVERFSMPTMGVAAERIAERWELDRAWLDELSLRSHRLASEAWSARRFDGEIVPMQDASGGAIAR